MCYVIYHSVQYSVQYINVYIYIERRLQAMNLFDKPYALWNCDESGIAGKGSFHHKAYGIKGRQLFQEDVSFFFPHHCCLKYVLVIYYVKCLYQYIKSTCHTISQYIYIYVQIKIHITNNLTNLQF